MTQSWYGGEGYSTRFLLMWGRYPLSALPGEVVST